MRRQVIVTIIILAFWVGLVVVLAFAVPGERAGGDETAPPGTPAFPQARIL